MTAEKNPVPPVVFSHLATESTTQQAAKPEATPVPCFKHAASR
ncbi:MULTISPECIES: hypothetical protein [Actinokineospora]|uniref:Uncharacterized protein n=1 Tax=Actinokineospora fastidiosa TaxID=1816 RepID=A0A918LG26_9PSEU|nr:MULTISPECIES: hypothetical protein [Actinokineospora]UVS77579.1 hypothetical protein Actkin_01294 [Actinokineospora sp. UTMC 2448]GGS42403.1 hypothetical protein GCM10010171_41570 [Actinokineospora fastidiosa]